jgi:poly-gamma-glutamate capsule biosynthesis protein CapA/YwtB (metallophosphatase superfamily)
MFRPIRPLVRRADLSICHVETPIGAGRISGYPLFNAPRELAAAIAWTGWDACTTASNHSVDRGPTGIRKTLGALDRAGVRHTGTARSRREARRILILPVGGIDVALLSYTYGTNGLPVTRSWSVNRIERGKIVRDARRARQRGADLVIAAFHWGVEYVHEPTAAQRALARFLLRRGIVDAIVGQHAHVVQPIRRIAGRFVVYGEGNLLSAQSAACCRPETQDGLIAVLRVRVEAGRARVVRADYVPTRVRRPDFAVERVGRTSASYLRTVRYAGRGRFVRPLPSIR